jgi:hypothetical protein
VDSGRAQCDPADFRNFATRNRSAIANPAVIGNTVSQGPVSVSMPLSVGMADAGLSPSGGVITPTTTVSIARWVWRLRADTRDGWNQNNLRISYTMGTNNTMVAAADSSSIVNATVSTRYIDERRPGTRNTEFQGFIDVFVDYTNATRAGTYNGILNITVDCN